MCFLNWNQICGRCTRSCEQCKHDARFRQECLIIILGIGYAILFCLHLSGKNEWIVAFVTGILFMSVAVYYILFQTRWQIVRHYFWWQFRPILIGLCGCGVVITNTIDILTHTKGWSYWTFCDTGVFFCAVLLFVTMDTMARESVSQILYVFYPLTLLAVSGLDFYISYTSQHFSVNVSSVYEMDTGQYERLFLSQIFLYSVISFFKAIRNPSRLYFSLLVKPVGRRQWIHESESYEIMKRFTLSMCLFWTLFELLALIFTLSTLDSNFAFFDIAIVIILFLFTVIIIFIEFDWKVLFKLLFHYRSFLIFVGLFGQFIAQMVAVSEIDSVSIRAMITCNVLLWSFFCFYMILIDGMRNIPWWYRLLFYGLIVLKACFEILGTWISWINNTLYPNTSSYYKNHETLGYAVSEVVRISWLVLLGVGFVSFAETFVDPNHDNFIMYIKSLSRKDVDSHLHFLMNPIRRSHDIDSRRNSCHSNANHNNNNNNHHSNHSNHSGNNNNDAGASITSRQIAIYGAAIIDQTFYTNAPNAHTHGHGPAPHVEPIIHSYNQNNPSGTVTSTTSVNSNTTTATTRNGDDLASNDDNSLQSGYSNFSNNRPIFAPHYHQATSPHASLLGHAGATRKMSGQRSVLDMPL